MWHGVLSLTVNSWVPSPDTSHRIAGFGGTFDSPTMVAPAAEQAKLELAEVVGLEQEPLSLNNGGKAKKPLSFYMAFLALSICVLLVSLDATALSVAVPASSTPQAIRFCWLTDAPGGNPRPLWHDARGLLGRSLLPPRRCGRDAHHNESLRCPGPQDPALCLLHHVHHRIHRLRRCQ